MLADPMTISKISAGFRALSFSVPVVDSISDESLDADAKLLLM